MKNGWELRPLGWVAVVALASIAIYLAIKAFDKDKREIDQYSV